jgi:asparagine synthase (glutamine-hydrolysing)
MLERITKGRSPLAPEIFPNALEKYRPNFSDVSNQPLVQLQKYYQAIYLPGLLLVEDSVSMAHSLETRVPLWSPEIISWANQIKLDEKMPGGKLKGLLRFVAKGVVPESILAAPKRGFPTPLRKWFRNDLYDLVRERLLSHSEILDLVMDRFARERLIKDHASRSLPFALDERRAHKIWILLCLESWARQFNVTFSGKL